MGWNIVVGGGSKKHWDSEYILKVELSRIYRLDVRYERKESRMTPSFGG